MYSNEIIFDFDVENLTPVLKKKRQGNESINEAIARELDVILTKYKGQGDSLLEVLHQVQQLIGFIPRPVQMKIARELDVAPGEVTSVISFYAHFTEKPKGKYQIALCKGTACYVKGSADIIKRIEKEYGIKPGESTDDGLFSLEVVRCLGCCGLSPAMTVNGEAHGLLNPEKAINILEKCKNRGM